MGIRLAIKSGKELAKDKSVIPAKYSFMCILTERIFMTGERLKDKWSKYMVMVYVNISNSLFYLLCTHDNGSGHNVDDYKDYKEYHH